MRDDDVGAVFSALGDATRRQVIRCLNEEGEMTATELAARLPVTRQAIAKHLATLSDAGLVDADKEGRELRYRLTPQPLTDAMGWMADVGAEWDARLRRLQRYLSS